MAYTNCAANLAANIAQDCAHPIVGGYTGRGVLIPLSVLTPTIVQDGENPRLLTTLSVSGTGVVVVDNVFAEPFTGSTTAGNADSGRPMYTKTMAVRIPKRGAATAKDIVEPLFASAQGFIGVFEKKDKVGDGSYEVIGLLQPMKGDIASLTRDESANGGDWSVNLVSVEPYAEVTLVGEDKTYASAKTAFEALIEQAV